MSEQYPFHSLNADEIVKRVRNICARHGGLADTERGIFQAAADRLEALSARVSPEGTSERPSLRELIQAKREGYIRAVQDNTSMKSYDAIRLARDTFALPPITRPVRVTLSDGSVWSYDVSRSPHDTPFVLHMADGTGAEHWSWVAAMRSVRVPDDVRALASILNGETEPVDADDVSSLPALDGSE